MSVFEDHQIEYLCDQLAGNYREISYHFLYCELKDALQLITVPQLIEQMQSLGIPDNSLAVKIVNNFYTNSYISEKQINVLVDTILYHTYVKNWIELIMQLDYVPGIIISIAENCLDRSYASTKQALALAVYLEENLPNKSNKDIFA